MLYSTHVGSFPLEHSRENLVRIVRDLAEVGLDYPPYPQLRDFISMFLDHLVTVGTLRKVGETYVLGERRELPPVVKLEEAEVMVEVVRSEHLTFTGLRGCVTGPFTLASQIQVVPGSKDITTSALRDKEFVLKYMVSCVRRYLEYLRSLGYTLLVVDEPILSVIVGAQRILFGYTPEEITRALDQVFENFTNVLTGIHVCGRLPPLLRDILLSTKNIKVLDHEFVKTPKNFEVYTRRQLEEADKYIAVGCVSNRDLRVEDLSEVRSYVRRGLELYGDRMLFVKPDCGFAALRGLAPPEEAYRVALEKLRKIVQVVREVRSSSA